MSAPKAHPKPIWWKNTYFWLAGAFIILSVVGLIFGDNFIRDPGQKPERRLFVMYFVAAIVAYANGYISHKQTVKDYEEAQGAAKE